MKKNKIINKVFISIIVCYVLVIHIFNRVSFKASNSNYGEDNYEEQIQFLLDNNVNIPDEFAHSDDFPKFLNYIFESLAIDLDYAFCFNYVKTIEFVEEIRDAIKNSNINISLLNADYRPIPNLKNNLVYKNGE